MLLPVLGASRYIGLRGDIYLAQRLRPCGLCDARRIGRLHVPTYSGFDEPIGADASGADALQDQAADAPADAADAADTGKDGPQEAAQDAADEVTTDAGEAGEDVAVDAGACSSNDDCTNNPAGPFCDATSGRCGSCLPSQDFCPAGEYCSAATLKC